MKEEKLTFKITGEDGKDIECEAIFTFEGKDNGKNYMVYTDNTLDAEGNTKVYASIYNPDEDEQTLQPIETDEEWEMVESILSEITKAAEEGNGQE